jgi:hypothetical protein
MDAYQENRAGKQWSGWDGGKMTVAVATFAIVTRRSRTFSMDLFGLRFEYFATRGQIFLFK